MRLLLHWIFYFLSITTMAQGYGDFPSIKKELLLNDLELLYQALDQYHSGMYWYTPKDSFDAAYDHVRDRIDRDMNVLEFHRLLAPLVSLSREDHTDIYLSAGTKNLIENQALFFPFTVVFLGKQMYIVKDGSSQSSIATGSQISMINGLTTDEIVERIGTLFASDGYIQQVKYSDLEGFAFSKYYYYYFGNPNRFEIQLKNEEIRVNVEPQPVSAIRQNIASRYAENEEPEKESLEFSLLDDSIAYLGIHTFSNSAISENKVNDDFSRFLEKSFEMIVKQDINTLIIDLSENGGGSEGNEGILYAYLDENYQKYHRVRAKSQKVILDNGVDKPLKFKTFGFFEKTFGNKKMPDGSYERKMNAAEGLMAFKSKPNYRYDGKVYVITSPITYSGGSELASMLYTRDRAVFVGQETGGGYYGNTSGYSRELVLPNSKIIIDIPVLQFVMNVDGGQFGRGVLPHHQVIPTFEQYLSGENAALNYILELELK